jgi:hypothetical protein
MILCQKAKNMVSCITKETMFFSKPKASKVIDFAEG